MYLRFCLLIGSVSVRSRFFEFLAFTAWIQVFELCRICLCYVDLIYSITDLRMRVLYSHYYI